jgi:hypothetical protein
MIAEIDAQVQEQLQKWNKSLESGGVADEHTRTSEEIKRKIYVIGKMCLVQRAAGVY